MGWKFFGNERRKKLKIKWQRVKSLKRNNEIQVIKLGEEIELRKKAQEDKDMIEDDTSILRNRLDETKFYVQKLATTKLEMMIQEPMTNDIEITSLKIK